MKKRLLNILIGSLLTVLLVTACLCPVKLKAEESETVSIDRIIRPTGDMAVRTPPKTMEYLTSSEADVMDLQMATYSPDDTGLLINKAKTYYYYSQLDPVAKEIYDVIYGVVKDPINIGNIGLMMTVIDPQSEEFYLEFCIAYRAICFDHPELFWLYSSMDDAELVFASEAISQNGFYFVYFFMDTPFFAFKEQMDIFNNAASDFLSDINTGISEYETVRQIHDKLIALVDYDVPVTEQDSSMTLKQDLAHTAYGALVADSDGNPNMAVCDGYSLAFEYLLQQCGIEAVFIGGMAGPDETDTGGHAWNMVKIDGVWYEVDSTWDDWDGVEKELLKDPYLYEPLLEAMDDPIYRNKIDHYLFLISSEEMRHYIPGDEYIYTSNDLSYSFMLPEENVHIRMDNEKYADALDAQIMKMAPVAVTAYQE